MTRYIIIVLPLILFSNLYSNNLDSLYTHAYITEDIFNWPTYLLQSQRAYNKIPSAQNAYKLSLAHYGYTAYIISEEKSEIAEQQLEAFKKSLDILKLHNNQQAAHYAFLSAYHAFRINLSPASAMINGPKILNSIEKAYELNKNDIQTWIEKGNIAYHAPKFIGGGYPKAIEAFLKAKELMELDNNYKNNWLYAHCLKWLINSYRKEKKHELAKDLCDYTLEVYPNYKVIKTIRDNL